MRRRKRAEWKRLMEEHDASDLSLAEFSAAKGLKKESFRWWRKVFRREERHRIEAIRTAQKAGDPAAPLTQRLIDLLAVAPHTAGELAPTLDAPLPTIHRELDELAELGLVYEESRKGRASRWHLG